MSPVFANLTAQLDIYKKLGPPRLSRSIMTAEDQSYAKKYKEWGLGRYEEEILDGVDFNEDDKSESHLIL